MTGDCAPRCQPPHQPTTPLELNMATDAVNQAFREATEAMLNAYEIPTRQFFADLEQVASEIQAGHEAAKRLREVTNCTPQKALHVARLLGPNLTNAITTRIAEAGLTLTDIAQILGEDQ